MIFLFYEFVKFVIYSGVIVLISKYILVRTLRNLAENLNLKPKTVGDIAGYATSVPELLTISASSIRGLTSASIYNIVGFQTNLKFGEQKKVFSLIPGLKNADFIKYGVMHRNTYINSSELLDETYNLKSNNNIFFAGQITGVEGYVESISSGLVASLNAVAKINKCEKTIFPRETVIGALAKYISTPNDKFQPMNANFGIIPELDKKIKDKKKRYEKLGDRALEKIKICQNYVNMI